MNALLETLVAKRLGWSQIADYIGINASSCEKQWRQLKQQQQQEQELERQQQQKQNCWIQAEIADQELHKAKDKSLAPRPFRMNDVELLKAAVAEHGTHQWDSIAQTVFQSRYTVNHLRYQYTKLEQKRRVWTLQQEDDLLQVVAGLVSPDQDMSPGKVAIPDSQWDTVADTIPGEHTGEECRRRWLKLQLSGSKRINKRKDKPALSADSPAKPQESKRVVWTAEQSRRLESVIQGMKSTQFPERSIEWKVVAERMGQEFTKTRCKSRWIRMSEHSVRSKTGPWNLQELELLFSGLLAVGPAWTEIHREWLPGRAPKFIQGKWKQVVNKVNQDQVIQRLTWQDACAKSFGPEVGDILDQAVKRWPTITTDRKEQSK